MGAGRGRGSVLASHPPSSRVPVCLHEELQLELAVECPGRSALVGRTRGVLRGGGGHCWELGSECRRHGSGLRATWDRSGDTWEPWGGGVLCRPRVGRAGQPGAASVQLGLLHSWAGDDIHLGHGGGELAQVSLNAVPVVLSFLPAGLAVPVLGAPCVAWPPEALGWGRSPVWVQQFWYTATWVRAGTGSSTGGC